MPTISCPNCDGNFRSKKDLTGKQVRCPRCDAAFVVGEEQAPITLSRQPASPPPRAAPPRKDQKPTAKSVKNKRRRRGKKRKSSAGGGIPKPLVVCLGVVLVIGGGWYGLEALQEQGVAIPGLPTAGEPGGADAGVAGMLGFTDTPESLMEEYTDCGADLQQVVAGVTDEESAQQAIGSIQGISAELVDIRHRALLATPVSRGELSSALRRFSEDEQLRAREVERIIEQTLESQPTFEEYRMALEEMTWIARSTKYTIRQYLEQMPDPRDAFEEIEQERAQLLRETMREVITSRDNVEVAAAAAVVRESAQQVQALAERKSATEGGMSQASQATAKYLQYINRPTAMMKEHKFALQRQRVDVEPLTHALIDLSEASSNFDLAQPQRATASRRVGGPGEAQGRRPTRGTRGQGMTGQGSRGRFTPSSGPAGPGEIVVVVKGEIFSQRSSDASLQGIIRKTRMAVLDELQPQIRAVAGPGSTQREITGGQATIRFPFDGDPQRIADALQGGTVDRVDAAARQVEFTLSPDLVDRIRQQVTDAELSR